MATAGMARLTILLAVLALWLPRALAAAPWAADAAAVCERAAVQAAAETGVPPDIMAALTLSETGRRRDGVGGLVPEHPVGRRGLTLAHQDGGRLGPRPGRGHARRLG